MSGRPDPQPTSAQAAVAAALRRELPALVWRLPWPDDGALRYASDTTPCVELVVGRDGGISMPLDLGPDARAWRREHPDSDRVYGYVPRTERIVRDALARR